jgi:hypothetical protein
MAPVAQGVLAALRFLDGDEHAAVERTASFVVSLRLAQGYAKLFTPNMLNFHVAVAQRRNYYSTNET